MSRLEEEKIRAIDELKKSANRKFKETSWYYERENRLAKGGRPAKPVPQPIINADMAIYDAVDAKEIEINNLTTVEEVLAFNLSL